MKKLKVLLAVAALSASTSFLANAELTSLQKNIQLTMKMDHRNEADIKRDRNRNPVKALDFFGLKQDMKVIEFAPGSGWYTKILGPVLQNKGELYLAYPKKWLSDFDPLLKKKGFTSTKKLPIDLDWNNEELRYVLGTLDFGMKDADMILNIREYHNFNLEDKNKLNRAAFNALKPGGKYVIVDHTRRHMEAETRELGRREDPVKVILEVQAAGFVLERSSDMFFRPDDELRFEVGRKTVTGNTDRFSLVFTKPK
ncbi:class I SAM-dependent methyltransferase [Pseudoalteromonas denitrificans]|uniref:Predicted methyltransferase n=1 Tax=Pseudoalteromonas denitrificans DSM 6059 TaxID=1123010 RepID=A0A1I1DVA9_9GAMM|nr:class I SAM-dependent methyltransferase [Pseudoalteromonas denitrificans]SFB78342.1 Predicted methyltransferase [Pseudoalteromonas denitrificans DSM 6059]